MFRVSIATYPPDQKLKMVMNPMVVATRQRGHPGTGDTWVNGIQTKTIAMKGKAVAVRAATIGGLLGANRPTR